MIRFSCSDCGHHISVDEKYSGKKGKCPKCGSIVVVPESSAIIVFNCDSCGHEIKVPQKHAGKKGKCPKCKNVVVVPPIEDKPASPDLYEDVYEQEQEQDEEYEESSGRSRRLLYIITGVAAVIVLGVIILVTVIMPSRSKSSGLQQDVQERQIVTETDSQPRPVTSPNTTEDAVVQKTEQETPEISEPNAEPTEEVVNESVQTEPKTLKVSYEDFPADLQAVLNKQISFMKSSPGIYIAGRVAFSDGTPITGSKDVMINLYQDIDEPLRVHEGGWFCMFYPLQPKYAGHDKSLVLRAFGYDPIDASITILNGEVTYVGFEMQKTPSEKLACIKGKVTDDDGKPLERTFLMLHFPFTYRLEPPAAQAQTDSNGKYSFKGLSGADYRLFATRSAYVSKSEILTVPQGKTVVKDVKLSPK